MDSPSPFGIKMADHNIGKPLYIEISDLPMRRGMATNSNKFVLGPSGRGKLIFMSHLFTIKCSKTENLVWFYKQSQFLHITLQEYIIV